MTHSNRWLVTSVHRPNAVVRLFCLPNAGGGASVYQGWAQVCPDFIELVPVQLPGREDRLGEAPIADLDVLAAELLTQIHALGPHPYAIFGHSMGAALGYRLSCLARDRGVAQPVALVVSAFRAPHLPPRHPNWGRGTDTELLARLMALGGIDDELRNHPEYLRLFLPTLRADLLALEGIEDRAESPLDCSITAMGGHDDEHVTVDELEAWVEHTTSTFRLRMFQGGHFYLHAQTPRVMATITDDIALALELRARPRVR